MVLRLTSKRRASSPAETRPPPVSASTIPSALSIGFKTVCPSGLPCCFPDSYGRPPSSQRAETEHAALRLLPLLGRLSGADRAQPQGGFPRARPGASHAGRRRAAEARLSLGEPTRTGAGARARCRSGADAIL